MSKICNQRKYDDNKKVVKQDAVLFKYLTSQPEKDSEQHLAPKLSENSCNDIKRLFRFNSTSSSPTNPFQYVESKDDEYWDFIDTIKIPRSGSPVSLSGSSSPSVYHDAFGDREEFWKPIGESPMTGSGINLGNMHDNNMEELQHNMPARAQKSNPKFQKKSKMVAEQLAAENKRKWIAWLASQEEDILRAKKMIPELTQSLEERIQEIGTLHAKIGALDKMTAKEARTDEKLKKANHELETVRRIVEDALATGRIVESGRGSLLRAWSSTKHGLQSINTNLNDSLDQKKGIIESQRCKIELLKEEIQRLGKVHEEDDNVIKNEKRKIHSLEGSSLRIFALLESFENLDNVLYNLTKVEEQDKAIIKQQRTENGELEAAEDISQQSKDGGCNYGEVYESLHELFEMAVAGGAAILRKLEMRPSGFELQ